MKSYHDTANKATYKVLIINAVQQILYPTEKLNLSLWSHKQ